MKRFFLTSFIIYFFLAYNSILSAGIIDTSDDTALSAFSTGGYSVYHLSPATVNSSGERVIISAAFDGTVLCHTRDGQLLWKNTTNKDFPFDLAVQDITGDGLDEIFVATAAGNVHAYSPDGIHLWAFSSPAPLYQVAPVLLSNNEWRIMTGGIEKKVFSLSPSGSLLNTHHADAVVRHIRGGNILGDGNDYVAVATTTSGLIGNLSLILLNPNTMQRVWRKTSLGNFSSNSGRRFFSMIIRDVNGDGKEDIIISASWGDKGLLYGFNASGDQILSNTTGNSVPGAAYRMNLLVNVDFIGAQSDMIIGVFANMLILYNANGTFNSSLDSKYDLTSGAFDPQTNTLYLGSSPSGGDGIYALNLTHPDWKTAYRNLKVVGNLAKVEQNLAVLNQQVNNFTRPEYQRKNPEVKVFGSRPSGVVNESVIFGSSMTLSEVITDPTELWCKNRDSRQAYNRTTEYILNQVRSREANKQNFVMWAGHGKAIYMKPSTMAAILLEAPTYFQGFIFAEMEQTDNDMQRIVNEILVPLAEQCKVAGKKIMFRNKNIFWNGTCYMTFYKNSLLDPRFHDVFVASLEETNCRTHELSLSGRVGLWMSGSFDRWGGRAVTDNACFDRMWEWSSQQVLSHYIRKIAMRASLGADNFLVDIHQARFSQALTPQLASVYNMIAKGVIAVPERKDLLSVSELAIGMKTPPNSFFLDRGKNGHSYNFESIAKTPIVFDRMDAFWGGAPLPEHDFSFYGLGVERRMLNFLPKHPYGLIAIIPDDHNINTSPFFKEKITTDGSNFINESGSQFSPAAYKQTVIEKLEQAAAKLPVLVKGDVAWTVVRLNPEYIRVTLIDPGYTDPADRQAEIVLQHLTGLSAVDILSSEMISISGNTIQTTVPAGVFRIIDIRHESVSVKLSEESKQIILYPNPSAGDFVVQLDNARGEYQMTISDISGRTVLADRILNIRNNYHIEDKGVFIVRISGDGHNNVSKLIIK
jgi:lambda-carrageenase